jgi:hypothetical protein
MKSVPSLLFFKPMKEEPEEHHWSTMDSYKMNLKIIQTSKGPYLRVSHTIKENPMEDGVQWIRLPYLVGEKCLDKSTGKVVTILSCEPIRVEEVTEEDCLAVGLKKITKDNGRAWKYGMADRDGLPGTDNTGWAWEDWKVDYKEAFKVWWYKRHPDKEWAWRVTSGITG